MWTLLLCALCLSWSPGESTCASAGHPEPSGLSASLHPDQHLAHIQVIQNSYFASSISKNTMTSQQRARKYTRNQTHPHGSCILLLGLYVALSCIDHLLPPDPVIDICSSFVDHCPYRQELPSPFIELCTLCLHQTGTQLAPGNIY